MFTLVPKSLSKQTLVGLEESVTNLRGLVRNLPEGVDDVYLRAPEQWLMENKEGKQQVMSYEDSGFSTKF